jgi:hypothetical protein
MNHIYHLPEHRTLRDQMQRFLEREVEPYGLELGKSGQGTTRRVAQTGRGRVSSA